MDRFAFRVAGDEGVATTLSDETSPILSAQPHRSGYSSYLKHVANNPQKPLTHSLPMNLLLVAAEVTRRIPQIRNSFRLLTSAATVQGFKARTWVGKFSPHPMGRGWSRRCGIG